MTIVYLNNLKMVLVFSAIDFVDHRHEIKYTYYILFLFRCSCRSAIVTLQMLLPQEFMCQQHYLIFLSAGWFSLPLLKEHIFLKEPLLYNFRT